MSCKFDRTNQRCNDEKLALGKLVESYKKEYDAEVRANAGKTKYDEKRKVHVAIKHFRTPSPPPRLFQPPVY